MKENIKTYESLAETLLKHLHKYKEIGFESQYGELKGNFVCITESRYFFKF
jgi:hypothetical protein